MELLLLVVGLILLDLLAMRYGIDSRNLNVRDGRAWWPQDMNGDVWHDASIARQARFLHEARMQRLASAASLARPRQSVRVRARVAHGVRMLAVRVDPTARVATANSGG